jgi:hypothetical protein
MGINEDKVEQMLRLAEEGRTPLARALLEDESVRLAAEKQAGAFLERCEDERDDMPAWMWNLLFFILGLLFAMSEPAIFNLIWNIAKAYNGGTV